MLTRRVSVRPRPIRRHRRRLWSRPWTDAGSEAAAYLIGRATVDAILAQNPDWRPYDPLPGASPVGAAYDLGQADRYREHQDDVDLVVAAMEALRSDTVDPRDAYLAGYLLGWVLGESPDFEPITATGDPFGEPPAASLLAWRTGLAEGVEDGRGWAA